VFLNLIRSLDDEDLVFGLVVFPIIIAIVGLVFVILSNRKPEPEPSPYISYCWGGGGVYLPCKEVPYRGNV
jgi:hypothetical protein